MKYRQPPQARRRAMIAYDERINILQRIEFKIHDQRAVRNYAKIVDGVQRR